MCSWKPTSNLFNSQFPLRRSRNREIRNFGHCRSPHIEKLPRLTTLVSYRRRIKRDSVCEIHRASCTFEIFETLRSWLVRANPESSFRVGAENQPTRGTTDGKTLTYVVSALLAPQAQALPFSARLQERSA